MKMGRSGWVICAVVVFAVGVTGSFLGSWAVARAHNQRVRQAQTTSAVEIAAALKLAIQREQDLVVNTAAFVINNPGATEPKFEAWVTSDRLFPRFPELVGLGFVTPVRGGATTAPPGPTGSSVGRPTTSSPYACFTTLAAAPDGQSATSSDLDVCATTLGKVLLTSRETGQNAYLPYGSGKMSTLALGTPVYGGGTVPTTVAARQADFLGWVGLQVLPHTVLASALQGHPDTAVAFRYVGAGRPVTFSAGHVPPGAAVTGVDLHNGWHVEVFARSDAGGVVANTYALALLIGGILISTLLALLIYVLATSRTRALALVRERTDELRYQAMHDPLTGLPNRALILDRLEQMLNRTRRQGTPVAALFVDLDDFKDINDSLGHAAGDELLVAVGARLTSALRQGDTVGRLGGDEFIVLAEGSSVASGAQVLADRMLDVLVAPFDIAGSDAPLSVTASIGFAEGDRPSPGRLLQDADIALYRAKAAGKARSVAFDPSMRAQVDDHHHIEMDLQTALASRQFFLVFQPTVDLSTGRFTGVEALLRWRHPVRGVVMPDQFIPALESSGLITPVGAWVLEEACRHGVAWAERGHPLVVNVNVSARQLERDRIVDDVHHALSVTGLDPARLVLELTETGLMSNVEASMARLQLLKTLGVRIAMDDFGTGYSSLAYLRQFPIDILKIDKTFVAGMADSRAAAALVHTLVQLGGVLNLETVAEGIETEEQRVLLQAEGVDVGQGYLFARPLEVAAFDELLDTQQTGLLPSP